MTNASAASITDIMSYQKHPKQAFVLGTNSSILQKSNIPDEIEFCFNHYDVTLLGADRKSLLLPNLMVDITIKGI